LTAYLRRRYGTYGPKTLVTRGGRIGSDALSEQIMYREISGVDDQMRFRGCLLGGAVGDALGAPVEFMSLSRICKHFGAGGIREYAEHFGRKGVITDDTQMTLFTAEGLIRALVRERREGSADYAAVTGSAYQRWLRTQGEINRHRLHPLDPTPGWLYGIKGLHKVRSPGRTCRAALRDATGFGEPANNDSKGCGGVVRIAPVGLFAETLEQSFELGCQLAALTHGHPTGWLAGGALAVMLTSLRQGAALTDAIDTALDCVEEIPGHEEIVTALELADDLFFSGTDADSAIAQLGEGWSAEEALGIATYCALKARDFREGITMAVNHDGDSDSTGALAGNLLGAMWGEKGIPAAWLKQLELRKVITEVADDLRTCREWRIGSGAKGEEVDKRMLAKYPGY
jgi:ADP-ribosylglycohydrolase